MSFRSDTITMTDDSVQLRTNGGPVTIDRAKIARITLSFDDA